MSETIVLLSAEDNIHRAVAKTPNYTPPGR